MFDLIKNLMQVLLSMLKTYVGSYGMAIILLTVLIRVVLWPVSRSQMESMKKMQDLQPKIKLINQRYAGDPQKMQAEMMKIYKEHKFNPFGGCLPMLIQLPMFIGLYWAISDPHFMTESDPVFLNVVHLKHTGILSHGGPSFDGKMNLASEGGGFLSFNKDRIMAPAKYTVILKNGTKLENRKVPNVSKAIDAKPLPGLPLQVTTSYDRLGLEDYRGQVQEIDMNIINAGTKEMETVVYHPEGNGELLQAEIPTLPGRKALHLDVMVLVAIFAASIVLNQKVMQNSTSNVSNDQQQQMMKAFPFMFAGMMLFIPIPAGVLLYMDTNGVFQLVQTWWFQRQFAASDTTPPSDQVVDVEAEKSDKGNKPTPPDKRLDIKPDNA